MYIIEDLKQPFHQNYFSFLSNIKKIPIIEGIIPTIINVIIDNEKTLAALTPNKPNNVINAASLVPNPLILIGIIATNVPSGIMAR
jgi:hypothetical protein